jgi:hypothetical protein
MERMPVATGEEQGEERDEDRDGAECVETCAVHHRVLRESCVG